MVKHAKKQHDIETLADRGDVIDGQLGELNVEPGDLRGKPRLPKIAVVAVNRDHAGGAAALHLERVESAVAADVEHRPAAQIGRDCVREATPFDRRIITEKM